MKTVKQANEELDQAYLSQKNIQSSRAKIWRNYVKSIEEKDIPVYHLEQTDFDYQESRHALREQISKIEFANRGFINLLCDDCGTMLFDNMVGSTLMSNPPKFHADCIGCGRKYLLDAALRHYADPIGEV